MAADFIHPSPRTPTIWVADAPGAAELVARLVGAGLAAEIYQDSPIMAAEVPPTHDDDGAIWLGRRVPAAQAIQAIRIAVAQWPHLKYAAVYGDHHDATPDECHDTLFIGGANAAAQRERLIAWSSGDFAALRESMDAAQLHQCIRAKRA